jgi:hypothetical protein
MSAGTTGEIIELIFNISGETETGIYGKIVNQNSYGVYIKIMRSELKYPTFMRIGETYFINYFQLNYRSISPGSISYGVGAPVIQNNNDCVISS